MRGKRLFKSLYPYTIGNFETNRFDQKIFSYAGLKSIDEKKVVVSRRCYLSLLLLTLLFLYKIIVSMLSEPPRRPRLRHINSFNDVIHLLNTCNKIIVLTGAGVSIL